MASYVIPHIATNTYFNEDALDYKASQPAGFNFNTGDTAIQTISGVTRNYVYSKNFWREVWTQSYTPVNSGPAGTFRSNLNSNFTSLASHSTTIGKNFDELTHVLANVATSGSADDIVESSTRKFVSPAEKEEWNTKVFADWSGSSLSIYQKSPDSTTTGDITDLVKDLFVGEIPTKTSELTNDAGYLVGTGYVPPEVHYALNQEATIALATEPEYTAAGFNYKGTFTLAGCTTNMVGVVVLSQDQAVSGNYSQVTDTGAGEMYIWMRKHPKNATQTVTIADTDWTTVTAGSSYTYTSSTPLPGSPSGSFPITCTFNPAITGVTSITVTSGATGYIISITGSGIVLPSVAQGTIEYVNTSSSATLTAPLVYALEGTTLTQP